MLILEHNDYQVLVRDDETYTAGSADNIHSYDFEYSLNRKPFYWSSQHSVTVHKGENVLCSCVLLAAGGASGIHKPSALLRGDSCIIAVGPFMCSLGIPSLELEWKNEVDSVTCCGVYYSAKDDCFISHGELEIARVDHSGKVLWQASGSDIFTNGFTLHDDYIEVVDFNDTRYRISIDTGASQ